MPTLYQCLLFLHITAGSIALITGTTNIILSKGGKIHQKIGRTFVSSMILTGGSALFMAQIKPNPFLFIVGIFSIYLVGTAARYIKSTHAKPHLIDWVYTLGMFVFGSIFIIWGVITLSKLDGMGAVMLVFGFIGLFSVYRDLKNYRGEINHPNYRLSIHIGRMVGGGIHCYAYSSACGKCREFQTVNPRICLLASPNTIINTLEYLLDQKKKKITYVSNA